MHTGEHYHRVIQSSRRDRSVRARFMRLALSQLPAGAGVLDFGAGTGIDAKTFAAHGHRTYAYEPSAAMRAYLVQHCDQEISRGIVTPVAAPYECRVHGVAANFAVFNHFDDHAELFAELSRVVPAGGFVLANMLSPYYLGDARYRWWRANLVRLARTGRYAIDSESRIHRFAPRVVAQAATPHFRLERLTPRGLGLSGQLYMFLLFRRN